MTVFTKIAVNRHFTPSLTQSCDESHIALSLGAPSFRETAVNPLQFKYVCVCLSDPLGCTLPPALHPGDSIKADRWSRPVRDSEHERPVLPAPFLQIIKPTLFPRINARSSGGWMEWDAESSQAWPFLLNLFPSPTAPLCPSSETRSFASPLYLTFRCDASFLSIMTLTLAVTFILSNLQAFSL